MANYYFLITFLPTLFFNSPLGITFNEFEALLNDNLTPSDKRQAEAIRRYDDILNFQAYWKGEAFSSFGSLNVETFEEALITRNLPHYVLAFVDKYEKNEEKVLHFPELLSAYFHEESQRASGFLKSYLVFERELSLVLAALRAKKLGKDLLKELHYDNSDSQLVAHILAQNDSPKYEPTEEFEDLKILFDQSCNDPARLLEATNEYRYRKIQELAEMYDVFSVNRLLAYMIQLILMSKWQSLDKAIGLKIFDTLLKELP